MMNKTHFPKRQIKLCTVTGDSPVHLCFHEKCDLHGLTSILRSSTHIGILCIFLFQDASNIETTIICIPAVVVLQLYRWFLLQFISEK